MRPFALTTTVFICYHARRARLMMRKAAHPLSTPSRYLLGAVLAVSLTVLPACDTGGGDPNAYETHIALMKKVDTRSEGFKGLERLVQGVSNSDNEARKQEFVDKVIPVFEELWDDPEAEAYHLQILEMCRSMSRPECAGVWSKAIVLDGSADGQKGALLALQGIQNSKATGALDALVAEFEKTVENPSKDKGDAEGEMRLEYATTLGVLGDAKAVPALIKALDKRPDEQPVAVHKAAVKSLGEIGDPAAIDALLEVGFKVPDAATSQNIGERSKQAIVALGPAATPKILAMLKGENEKVNKVAAEKGIDITVVKQAAVAMLGAMGDPAAVPDLVAYMPSEDCGTEAPEGEADPELVLLRAFVAQSLGFIGDEAAVEALCSCRNATRNPGDLWEITQALGRIGGPAAFECVSDIVANGKYDADAVANSEFIHQIRWEAARFLILAAAPGDVDKVKAIFDAQTDPKVKENLTQWQSGIAVMEKCKADVACYEGVLADVNAEWFAREKAAVEVYRAKKGDKDAALAMSEAFKVRSPDARITMAWLAARTLDGTPCPECATKLQDIMDSEKGSAKAEMQGAWLTARVSQGKMRRSK